jgi:hypothetical protein
MANPVCLDGHVRRLQDPGAERGVRLHLLVLLVAERAGLLQD